MVTSAFASLKTTVNAVPSSQAYLISAARVSPGRTTAAVAAAPERQKTSYASDLSQPCADHAKQLPARTMAKAINSKEKWCPRQGSNPRPPDYKSGALPTELQGQCAVFRRKSVCGKAKIGARFTDMVKITMPRERLTGSGAEPIPRRNGLWLQVDVMYHWATSHQGSPCLARSGRSPSSPPYGRSPGFAQRTDSAFTATPNPPKQR